MFSEIKENMLKEIESGQMSVNQCRRILGLSEIIGGDCKFIRVRS